MSEELYLQLIEKMLSDDDLKAKVDETTIEKLRVSLSAEKLPKATDLASILNGQIP